MAASKNVSEWTLLLTPAEWLDLSTGEYDAATYGLIRDNLLRIITKAMVEKRAAADQDTDGPEFDAAMAPVVAALGAPLFEGLQEATRGLGLDLTAPDYTATVTRANRLASSIERRTVSENDARKAIGTLMFVKGVAGYNEWKNTMRRQAVKTFLAIIACGLLPSLALAQDTPVPQPPESGPAEEVPQKPFAAPEVPATRRQADPEAGLWQAAAAGRRDGKHGACCRQDATARLVEAAESRVPFPQSRGSCATSSSAGTSPTGK